MGRRIWPRRGGIKIFPHAFYGENAYYDPDKGLLLFGYFQADDVEPGANLPGQMVFTCLSHDIVAHETTHAVIDRLRPGFNEATNPDMLAFHEAIADLVAIFQHFRIERVLIDAINNRKADLTSAEAISGLARQFGFASAQKQSLRTALDDQPDPTRLARTFEPHERGVILVQAVFSAYRTTYLARVQDLLRLASGGSGILQEGRPHPDLVNRLAREATRTAQLFFDRVIQAFAYLPPVDVTFSDFLRAIVTVDGRASPTDPSFRTAVIEACRRRGIYATEAGSLGDEAVALRPVADDSTIEDLPTIVSTLLTKTLSAMDGEELGDEFAEDSTIAANLHAWAVTNYRSLGLRRHEPGVSPIRVAGFSTQIRRELNGQPIVETVIQFTQRRVDLADRFELLDGIVPVAGTTVVAGPSGNIQYVVKKPLPVGTTESTDNTHGKRRLSGLHAMVDEFDREDPRAAYRPADGSDGPGRRLRVDFARLHGGFDRREEW